MRNRILSIILFICAVATVVPAIPAYAGNPFRLLISPQNFDGSGSVKRESSLGNDYTLINGGAAGADGGGIGGYILKTGVAAGSSPAATVFYIPEDNQYRIFVHVKDFNTASARLAKVKIDGNLYTGYFCTRSDIAQKDGNPATTNPIPAGVTLAASTAGGTFYWDGGESHHSPVTLTKGWHSLNVIPIVASGTSGRFDSVLIMKESDAAYFPTPLEAIANYQPYQDIAAPVFSGAITQSDVTETGMTLHWNVADTGSAVVSVDVYRNDNWITTVDGATNSYEDTGLDNSTIYTYRLKAKDMLGQSSELSATLSPRAPPDHQLPAWPVNASISCDSKSEYVNTLSWTAAQDNIGIKEYAVYSGTIHQENLLAVTSATKISLNSLLGGKSYHIIVVARDMSDNLSLPLEGTITPKDLRIYALRMENFTLPSPVGGWSLKYDETAADNRLPGYSYLTAANMVETPVTAEIYFSKDSRYVIWANVRDYAVDKPGSRSVAIDVEDVTGSASLYGTLGQEGWYWQRGREINIKKGWHTIQIRPGAANMRVAAVYITDGLTEVLDNGTTANYGTKLRIFEDITGPGFSTGAVECKLNASGSFDLRWPQAADGGIGLKEYRVTTNKTDPIIKNPGESAATISGLWDLDDLSIRLEALDGYGQRVSRSIKKTVSPFEEVNLFIGNQSNGEVTSLDSFLPGSKIRGVVSLKNATEISRKIWLGIAVYHKATGRMVANKREPVTIDGNREITDSYVETMLPEGFSASTHRVKVMLWDGDDLITPAWSSVSK